MSSRADRGVGLLSKLEADRTLIEQFFILLNILGISRLGYQLVDFVWLVWNENAATIGRLRSPGLPLRTNCYLFSEIFLGDLWGRLSRIVNRIRRGRFAFVAVGDGGVVVLVSVAGRALEGGVLRH